MKDIREAAGEVVEVLREEGGAAESRKDLIPRPDAYAIAKLASSGADVSASFTNEFTLVRPPQRIQTDSTK
jgi:hypothetical protein